MVPPLLSVCPVGIILIPHETNLPVTHLYVALVKVVDDKSVPGDILILPPPARGCKITALGAVTFAITLFRLPPTFGSTLLLKLAHAKPSMTPYKKK